MAAHGSPIEKHWPLIRDVASFAVGVYVVVVQLDQATKDPIVLAFGGALMGVPAALAQRRDK